MILLLPLIVMSIFAYLYWKHRTTTLTRNCRWRQHRAEGLWRCAYCGAELSGATAPKVCLQASGGTRSNQD